MSSGNLIPPNNFITGEFVAPSGTRLPFHQAAAPLGWVIDGTIGDHALAIRTGSGGTTLAGTTFSTFSTGGWTSGGHSLSVAELASHNHGVTDPTHSHQPSDLHSFYTDGTAAQKQAGTGLSYDLKGTTTSVATGITIQNNGSGAAHTHPMSTTWQVAQCIIAQKS